MKFVQDARLIAAELRSIADRVEVLGVLPSEVRVALTFTPVPYSDKFSEADRIAAVEVIAAGVVGQRTVRVPNVTEREGVHLQAKTPDEFGQDEPDVAVCVYEAVTTGPGEWRRLKDEADAYRINKYHWLWEKYLVNREIAGGDQ